MTGASLAMMYNEETECSCCLGFNNVLFSQTMYKNNVSILMCFAWSDYIYSCPLAGCLGRKMHYVSGRPSMAYSVSLEAISVLK